MKRLLVIFALLGVVGTAGAFAGGALPGPKNTLGTAYLDTLYCTLTGCPMTGTSTYTVASVSVNAAGQVVTTRDPATSALTDAALLANPATCAANELLVGAGVAGTRKASLDCEGDLVAVSGSFTGTVDVQAAITQAGTFNCNGLSTTSACVSDASGLVIGGVNNATASLITSNDNTSGIAGFVAYNTGSVTIRGEAGYFYNTNQVVLLSMTTAETTIVGNAVDVAATTVATQIGDTTGRISVYGDDTISLPVVTPSALAGDVNDYAGCTVAQCRIDSGGSARNVTGIANGAGQKQFVLCAVNATGAITLVHESASSTAANRFKFSGATNRAIAVDECFSIVYDATTARWRELR